MAMAVLPERMWTLTGSAKQITCPHPSAVPAGYCGRSSTICSALAFSPFCLVLPFSTLSQLTRCILSRGMNENHQVDPVYVDVCA